MLSFTGRLAARVVFIVVPTVGVGAAEPANVTAHPFYSSDILKPAITTSASTCMFQAKK
jgi:hypothetical protein